MKTINAIGDLCPMPVVKTKNAIKEMTTNEELEILVDNEIAVQNLEKMAAQKGYPFSSKKLEDRRYQVIMTAYLKETIQSKKEEELEEVDEGHLTNALVVISSDKMGAGIDELGQVLMKGFLFALTQQDELPNKIIFYNGGAKLTCEGSDSLEDLKYLASQGVEILTCGTCIDYHNLKGKLLVGTVTNMYEITESMFQARKIIKP